MNDTLLYTLPQWFIFSAIFVAVYGWIEDKKPFRIIGSSILVILGFFSLYIVLAGFLSIGDVLTPEEIVQQEMEEEVMEIIPFQTKLIPAYWSFILAAIFALPAIFLDIKNNRKFRIFLLVSGLVCLFGFFIIVGAVRNM